MYSIHWLYQPNNWEIVLLKGVNVGHALPQNCENDYELCQVRPSVRPQATTLLPVDRFSRNFIFEGFSKENFKISLNSDKVNGYFIWRPVYILLRMRNISDRILYKIKTHILCSIMLLQKSCRWWDNVEKYDRTRDDTDGNTIRRMRNACWVTKLRGTHSEYVILIAFPRLCYVIRTLPVLLSGVQLLSVLISVLCSVTQLKIRPTSLPIRI